MIVRFDGVLWCTWFPGVGVQRAPRSPGESSTLSESGFRFGLGCGVWGSGFRGAVPGLSFGLRGSMFEEGRGKAQVIEA